MRLDGKLEFPCLGHFETPVPIFVARRVECGRFLRASSTRLNWESSASSSRSGAPPYVKESEDRRRGGEGRAEQCGKKLS